MGQWGCFRNKEFVCNINHLVEAGPCRIHHWNTTGFNKERRATKAEGTPQKEHAPWNTTGLNKERRVTEADGTPKKKEHSNGNYFSVVGYRQGNQITVTNDTTHCLVGTHGCAITS